MSETANLLERISELEQRIVELDAEAQREAIVAGQILIRLRRLLERVCDTWTDSWDCSRTPGHPLMESLMADIERELCS